MNTSDFEFFHYSNDYPINVEYHNHDFYEILFFISGKVKYIIEGKTYTLKPNDIVITNNKELHKPIIDNSTKYERYVLWINPNYLKSINSDKTNLALCFNDLTKSKHNLIRTDVTLFQIINSIYKKLEISYADLNYGDDLLKKIYLTELLIYLNKAYFHTLSKNNIENDIKYNSKINNVVNYINENLCEDLSLDTLANKFYISKYHLSRQFKQFVGFSIHQYIIKKRLIIARITLTSGNSIEEAFIASGFNSYANFLKSFKEEFGLSPKKFMELYT
ncbi:MAG TPA: AraC family transcriptional regulator, partial [Clostridium sp.]|nr:AraC family transcriptional regulator [Clostridium sp.]